MTKIYYDDKPVERLDLISSREGRFLWLRITLKTGEVIDCYGRRDIFATA